MRLKDLDAKFKTIDDTWFDGETWLLKPEIENLIGPMRKPGKDTATHVKVRGDNRKQW